MSETNERAGVHDKRSEEEKAVLDLFSIESLLGEKPKLEASGKSSDEKVKVTASKKQIAANRRNAKCSTGPRTGAGKAKSAMNSTRHGLLAQFHPTAGEDPQEFSKFEEEIRADLKPEGGFEESLVDRIIKDTWRLNRFDNVEGALLQNLESLDDLSISELLNVLRFFCGESGRTFDRLLEEFKFLMNNERNLQTLAQNKLDPGSVGGLS
ncbi:hypothetical protein [Candidatus Binatus sp.]|jgi:hypothetical protein|uniref:hypothetical protein n=1 Tax=Candidatus Binatus sp. TaxID=2811406 RepID=UPI002FDAFB56